MTAFNEARRDLFSVARALINEGARANGVATATIGGAVRKEHGQPVVNSG